MGSLIRGHVCPCLARLEVPFIMFWREINCSDVAPSKLASELVLLAALPQQNEVK